MEEPNEPAELPLVRCVGCERTIGEDDAQAARWGYWFMVGELYPFCPECARREFGSDI